MIVRILPAAEAELEDIGDYIARDNPGRAVSFVRELREKCVSLAHMGLSFPLVQRYDHHGARHRVHGNYQSFYRIVGGSDERVDVIHILHSARNYAAILFP